MLDLRAVETQTLFATLGDRIEESEALYITAIACAAAVSNNDVIKRPLLRARPCKTYGYQSLTLGLEI